MHKLLFGPVIVLALGAATPGRAASLPDFKLSPPPVAGGDAPLAKPLALDVETLSIDNALVQSYRAGGIQVRARTRADAFGRTVTAELRAPLGLSVGRLFLRPFVNAGGGLGTSDLVDRLATHTSDGLIWTAKVGFYLRTSEQVVWQLSYRHIAAPDFDISQSAAAAHVRPGADVVGAELKFVLGR